jgi:hypothetical protein
MTRDEENEAAHLLGMCWDWAVHPACDGYPGLSDFLRRCGASLKAQQAEIGRLRVAVRVNALRQGATDADIDAALYPDGGAA